MDSVRNMKKKYPFVTVQGLCMFYDFGIIDMLGTPEDAELIEELENGYGAAGTISRLKVELQRVLDSYPDTYKEISACFTSAFGRSYYVTVTCKKAVIYHDCRALYSIVTAMACTMEVYEEDRKILERNYKREPHPIEGAVVSQNGTMEEVFV